ncbi:fasciclin domain-containing protein [Paraflavisolibacter sp. H34]|uniref:fasciclin domain-containing protein n=1 Tax=Huijunlia imazamoxiresistens TaxID=3127457 RepID=UPI00301A1E3D
MKKTLSFIVAILAGVLALGYLNSCKKVDYVTATTTDVNMYDYLVQHPSQFSEFAKMVEKAGYGNFLNAYGSYTMFAPTNEGVQKFLQASGKASVDAMTQAELQKIVKFHLIQDTINTSSFTDGKLQQVTMLGQYLVTGVSNINGTSSYTVNRQAVVTQPNIRLSNGNVHVLDNVLVPAEKTVWQTLQANPDFSIFTQAVKETGFDSLLNIVDNPDTTRRFLTVVAETNKALADSGITSYDQLKAKYSNKVSPKGPKDVNDTLHQYVAYHIFTDAKYLADIVSTTSLATLQPLEVITPKLEGEKVLLNDITFNSVHEPGVELIRSASDVSASNGVVHTAKSHLAIKVRVPVRVDFDVADQPELRKLPNIYGQATTATAISGSNGGGVGFARGTFADIITGANSGTTSYVNYNVMPATNTTYYGFRGDYLRIPMGTTSRNLWIQFRTPLLVKGRYKVWICYYRGRASTNNPAFPNRVQFISGDFKDTTNMDRTFDFSEQKPVGTPGELEALNYKQYTEAPQTNSGADLNNVARMVGIVDVKTTDRHNIKITFAHPSSTGQEINYLDMIQFIPISENQLKPLFGRDGKLIY